MTLTAGGVAGSFDAVSAAFAFASVTMSAQAVVVTASINEARTQLFTLVIVSSSASAVHVQAEGQSSAVNLLRLLLQWMEARRLDVAEQPLESEGPIERGAADYLHRLLDRPDGRSPGERSPDEHLVGRLGADRAGRGGVDHVAQRHPRRGQLVLHLADQRLDARVLGLLRGFAQR